MPTKKLALALGCLAFLALSHASCAGLAGDVCQRACDCQPNCDHNGESICEDDADDVQAKVDAAGCDKVYNDLLSCENNTVCKEQALDVTPCKAKADIVQACLDKHDALSEE